VENSEINITIIRAAATSVSCYKIGLLLNF